MKRRYSIYLKMSKVQGSGASSAVQRSVHSDEATKGEKDSNPIAYFKSFMNSSTLKKDKNERSRFLGDGVSYKAKLIGILEVSEARGDRMCQEALADLKMAIRAAGEHKQRININIAIDGLRLRDEKTGDCLYHHPVHKISFIAQDMSDSRAFGYIFGSPDTGHRFFGIKTDKAASQVVISMRDLFQVVFELKKKEIEMAKQHIEQHQVKFTSNLLAESSVVKVSTEPMKMLPIAEDKNKEGTCGAEGGEKQEQIMDLLGLELELNNIQQGINQMERITPSDPFGPPTLSKVQADPFGDSFNPLTSEAKLPPPPDSTKRSRVAEKHWFDQETEALFEETDLPTSLSSLHATAQPVFSPPGISMPLSTQCVVDENTVRYSESSPTHEQFDVFTELDPLGTGRSKPYIDKKDFFQELKNPPKKVLKDLVSEVPADIKTMFQTNFGNDTSILLSSKTPDQVVISKTECSTQAFTDPFQDDPFDRDDPFSEVDFPQNVCFNPTSNNDPFEKFADFASFNTKNEEDLTSDVKVQKITSVPTDDATKNVPLRVSLPPEKHNNDNVFLSPQQSRKHKLQKHNTVTGIIKLPSPKQKVHSKFITQASVDDFVDHGSMEGVTLRNRSLTHSLSNGSTCSDLVAPEPPPRLSTNAMAPPLPPKRLAAASVKPPPRPPQSDYDYIENYQTTNVCNISSPPLPAPARKPKNDQKPSTETEYYLQPFPLLPPPKKKNPASPKSTIIPSETSVSPKSAFCANKSLDITLSQLTKTGFSDLAATLNMSPTSLSKMTLQDLTKCLAKLATENKEEGAGTKLNGENKIDKNSILNSEQYLTLQESLEDDTPAFPVEFDVHFDNKFQSQLEESLFDKYAVFRELLEQEKKQIDAPIEKNVKIIDESDKETDFKILKDEDSVPQTECSNTQPVEDRYAALRDICLDEVLYEDEEGDGSDKDDSIADPSRMEEDNDLLSQSHPHSESTESPTLTMKEHQSIMETTIMEEDVSALEVDEDEAPEESVDDTLQGTSPQNFIKYEEDNNNPVQASPNNEKPLFSPAEEIDALVKNKQGNQTPVGSVVPWAKFDNGTVLVLDKGSSVHSEGRVSPWSTESKDNDTSPACREQRKHRKTKRHKQNLRQEDEESEEGWGGRSPSCWSPSWRENGWSDGDSLYDETHPYMDRDYHSPRRGRRRRLSPWNSRDHSPWEEDDRDLIEGQWENARWQEEPRPRPKHRTLWDEERKHHYDDPRKPRKSMMWTNEMDRKSSRESLAWEDDDRYQKRNYTDRRRRKWDDESHSRNRGWREREWIEPGIKLSSRYYRERSHEPSWEDLYSEHGDDEAGHWSQRPRSCERGRRQYSSHHSNDGDYGERRFIHSMNREDYCAELDYRWKSHTLQRKKSRRKHSQNSPFEDDFMSHFSFSKDIKSPGDGSDVFDPDVKQGTPQSDSHKKCSFSEGSKKKEYISSSSHVGSYSRDGMMPLSKGFRSYQQSPFEDDFTSPTPRRSSGRSASSDISDPKGSDDIYLETKDSFTQIKIEPNKQPRRANQIDTFTGNKPSKYGAVAAVEAGSDSNGGKTTDQVEHENITIETPSINSEKKPTDFKQVPTNLIRSDSNTSLRKSESVNIFARNRDPFDDDFFCEDVSPVQQRNEKKIRGHELNKWTDTFNAFSFDEESK